MNHNRIEAIKGRTEYLGSHLVIAVDGLPLDQRLHAAFPSDRFLEGLVPTLLGWHFDEWEQTVTWERILPEVGSTAIAPVLMCPDDLDLYCTLLVAEVLVEPETVRWNRLGLDRSEDRRVAMATIEWFPGIGPYTFPR